MNPARALLEAWFLACLASTKCTNMVRVAGVLYMIDHEPRQLQNGAIEGHVYRFGSHGQAQFGTFKISPAGTIARLPDELADALPAVVPAPAAPQAAAWDEDPDPLLQSPLIVDLDPLTDADVLGQT